MIQTIYFIFLLLHSDLVFLIICCDQQYQRPVENQQNMLQAKLPSSRSFIIDSVRLRRAYEVELCCLK